MGAAGSPGAAFARACERGNVLMALAALQDLRQPLALEYALMLTEAFARAGDERFEAAAVRWLARLADERRPSLAGMRIAVDAVAALPDTTASRVLRELVRRR